VLSGFGYGRGIVNRSVRFKDSRKIKIGVFCVAPGISPHIGSNHPAQSSVMVNEVMFQCRKAMAAG
jgi:hypothetical protein